jgi:hypothetical protein
MDWGRPPDPFGSGSFGQSDAPARTEQIELIGPHLRVKGEVGLQRFNRLSDLVNHSRGYIRLADARLLRRNGDPTNLVVPELMVNQDEVTFVAQQAQDVNTAPTMAVGGMDRPLMARVPRQLVIFTSGHTLTARSISSRKRTWPRSSTRPIRGSSRWWMSRPARSPIGASSATSGSCS